MEKNKITYKNKKIVKNIILVAAVCALIYIIYMIYSLIKQPTNVFVIENGKLTMEEEAVRLCIAR